MQVTFFAAVQNQREVTLAGFRSGKFPVLVATDVAARGLDISGVELVVQCEPPKDPETYIHRSGTAPVSSQWQAAIAVRWERTCWQAALDDAARCECQCIIKGCLPACAVYSQTSCIGHTQDCCIPCQLVLYH